MVLKQAMEMFELLDSSHANGGRVKEYLEKKDAGDVYVCTKESDEGSTDFIRIVIPGSDGKSRGGTAPTLGIVGRLGGLGARPERIGFVSDGDGALTALTCASKILDMNRNGDYLPGDVYICTHICPDAPTLPHDPVPFMDSPVDMEAMNEMEVCPEMDAILSIDTTRGNRIINHRGFAISPTVKEGYILKVSEDLLDIMEHTSGDLPVTFPITMQDITPYGNGVYHVNSILQPSTATASPVVGVAITARTMVPGCMTGATCFDAIDGAARFVIEVAKRFGEHTCSFYDEEDFRILKERYGSMSVLQTRGK